MTSFYLIRLLLLLVVAATLTCCNNADQETQVVSEFTDTVDFKIAGPRQVYDTAISEWIEDFKAFRNAVYRKDKEALKSYFDLPIKDAEELWYYIGPGNDSNGEESAQTAKPFTEADFNKYFDELFPEPFVSTLMKVKSKELAEKGSVETPSVVREDITYSMLAEVDKADRSLRLSLVSLIRVDEDNVGESSATYVFEIIENKKLKFVGIRMAG